MIYTPDYDDDYTREPGDIRDQNRAWKLFEGQVGRDIAMIFAGQVNSDIDYTGMSPYYKIPVVRLEGKADINLIHKRMLKAGYEYEKFQTVRYSSIKHVDDSNSIESGVGDKIYLFVKIKDIRFIIFFSETWCRDGKTSRTFIEQFASLHKGHKDYKLIMVETAIHEARKRVLGDKYNPEIMFTKLRNQDVFNLPVQI